MKIRRINSRAKAAQLLTRRFLSIATTLFMAAAAVPGFAQYGLTCASEDGHRHYCAADTRAGVTMQRQRSKSACIQGTTWGFDQQGVWVDRGCRADFLVNAPQVAESRERFRDHDRDRDRDHDRGGDGDRYYDRERWHEETMQLTCSSDDGRKHYCESDIQGEAELVRQRSGSPCRQGYSWGNDRRGIWVDHGCRADFQLKGRRTVLGSNYNPGFVGTLKCSSDFGTLQYCAADTRNQVRISRQISESACRLGYSWGYDKDGIWVDHGCRAEFEIGYRR
ncbi:MAG TPA: DUF3011 domain-containing protein [Terriglobales bacterium]|nr:DUF3011 domain-containing protein [Terriglobales bacterium]